MGEGSRELEGEGGEGFYTAQTSRRPDLLVYLGGEQRATEDGTQL